MHLIVIFDALRVKIRDADSRTVKTKRFMLLSASLGPACPGFNMLSMSLTLAGAVAMASSILTAQGVALISSRRLPVTARLPSC
ncbi:hypothetical protein ABNX41_16435 [Rhodobacteraceae bacterium PA1-206B]